MPRGYDEVAEKAFAIAKVLAFENQRAISLEDLFVGCLAAIDLDQAGLTPSPSLQGLLGSLRWKEVKEKVKVAPEVAELDQRLRQKCRAEGREVITVWDILAHLSANPSEGLQQLTRTWGMDLQKPLAVAQERLSALTPPVPPSVLEALRPFTINLTEKAAQGRLGLAFGRDKERQQIVSILLRKSKRNVAVVGPAGVGKTKLVEDLAVRMYRGEIPRLAHCLVLALDLVGLRAGASAAGELEERLTLFRKTLEQFGEHIILFIDELHTIVGSSVGGRVLDMANALKPLLAAGTVRCIGATTRQEYVEYIESDRALARRFEMVALQEPSNETMLQILEQVKGEYEAHHGVIYVPETLQTILDLCDRFIPMRHYPDKAIELLDSAGAWANVNGSSASPVVVTPEMVRQGLAQKLGLSAEQLIGDPAGLAQRLAKKVVGQEEALAHIEEALLNSRWPSGQRQRPRAVFLFVGLPNVGKTLTAKTLAQAWCGNERAFLEIDLNQLVRRYSQESGGVDALIGVRPPYVGWERGGILTNHVLEFPRNVVMVRGLENAPSEVHRLFESLFQRGQCEDGRGQQVDFRETVFVFLWETEIQQKKPLGFLPEEPKPLEAGWNPESLKEQWKAAGVPEELLAHIQHVIAFRPLDKEALRTIAWRKLEALRESLFRHEGKLLEIDEGLVEGWLGGEKGLPLPAELEELVEEEILSSLQKLKGQNPQGWAQWKVISLKEGKVWENPRARLLVVDDVPDFFQALQTSYPEWSWSYAATVEEAEKILEQERPHLVLVDTCQSVTNPKDVRGLEILQQLKAKFPQQAVVMVTAQPVSFEATREAFKGGAYDYLWKPPEESLLRQLVGLLLKKEEHERQLDYHKKLLKRFGEVKYQVGAEAEKVTLIFGAMEEELSHERDQS
jgi:ATP-dependent Clp protease ATP-binding subunit ClpA/DNA-binding response OmpR family regulator